MMIKYILTVDIVIVVEIELSHILTPAEYLPDNPSTLDSGACHQIAASMTSDGCNIAKLIAVESIE